MAIRLKTPRTPDRLSLLRAKYTTQLRAKKAEVAALEQKIALINEFENESSALQQPATDGGHYSGMNLTEAALDAVKELAGKATVADVKKHLISNGWIPKGKNFTITVAKTLQRLREQGKLETDLRTGKRRYWNDDAVRLSVLKAI